ncbi:two-component system LytT family sensor kinase [Isoptericola sp. CG 20/1183]|uniref:histidine kinase n=1 Tax=Isoptericola halotolerans TaxID=300560 RepID=A0ABX5EHG1_9MICO|nr:MULTISPECIES: histidine kinase [Isoptericola]PRZ07644.1 two-component system LytT family sensor kinase [Isoptericola halotolerans]PRZ07997.1 two-component system LytT family sensor kinase [Isoptericola sp. CG 20/1183]
MRGGSALLAGVLVAAWAAVYLITQVLVAPPLGVLPTLASGLVVSTVVVLGYPSALRGPRGGPLGGSAARARSWPPARRPRDPRGMRDGLTIAAAGRSMPLRNGLTPDAARRTAQLIRPLLGGDAIAITDTEQVLAFVGPGSDHHHVGGTLQTRVSRLALGKKRTVVVHARDGIGCPEPGCPLRTAVVAPLAVADRVVGTLKVYRVHDEPAPRVLVDDMASMLSLHLELAEMDRERHLASDAKLDALRAQINPHFLFNILNTIASKSRTDPDESRQLLLRLSDFFRYAVRQDGHFAEFSQEYFFVRTYVSLEQARFGDRLRVRYDLDPQVLTSRVPVLVIQPLVENAIKHGIADSVTGGTVHLRARVDPLTRTTSIRVSDDGAGMAPEVLDRLLAGKRPGTAGPQHSGVGLWNISQRLDSLFGDRYSFDVASTPGKGTTVDLQIPLR